ncbi:DNA topoisomerase IB [Leptolyngbya ohadii]|uniref:DNA topoisomerase IB n=1 Tax=Leptolyngbya ohadii TaxID=1962290 RepID=UPI000B59CE54|nr:DNA topoisomerase IB [Leptolyngbya ohadii]
MLSAEAPSIANPIESAKAVGLRYVNDTIPGIRRHKSGDDFVYVGTDGKPIRDPEELERFKALIIPPAWTDVWICPLPDGHLQATGRDAKGRKQYRYHADWRKIRSQNKFDRMVRFAQALPIIREQTDRHLRMPGLAREKVLATVVQLLEKTLIRVGNEEYAQTNESFGLTTLRDDHIEVTSTKIVFHFRGKSGVEHEIELGDRRLARVVKSCRDVPGQELFQYIDENGERQTIDSKDVNDYIHEITQENFTAKDFRTWMGTVHALQELHAIGLFTSQTQAKKNVTEAIKNTAKRLGNRPATCRKYYIHPNILDAYLEEKLFDLTQALIELEEAIEAVEAAKYQLRKEERAVLAVLEAYTAAIEEAIQTKKSKGRKKQKAIAA